MSETENLPDLDRFGLEHAWWLGSALIDRCRSEGLPVTVSIRIGEQRVFHAALPGTSADDDGWERKARAVSHFGQSSAAVCHRYVKDNQHFFETFALAPAEYAPYPGAVPITVRGTIVGTHAISGLTGEQDHDLAVEAQRAEADSQADPRRRADRGHRPDAEQPDLHPTYRTLRTGQRAQIWIGGVDLPEPDLLLETTDLLIEAPNWSPNGHTLYVNGNGRLWSVDLRADAPVLEPVPFVDLPEINNDHVLSPDGTQIYLSANDGHIYRGAVTGGSVERITRDEGVWHYLHGVSPDNTRLAYVRLADSTSGQLAVMTLSGASVILDTGDGHLDGPEWSSDGAWIYLNTEAFSTEPGHAQLARIPDGGGLLERLISSATVDWFPHLSPDNQFASYVSFPAGTLGHPPDLDVTVNVVATDDWTTSIRTYPVFGGQGTLNVNSWAPDSTRFAFVGYPLG